MSLQKEIFKKGNKGTALLEQTLIEEQEDVDDSGKVIEEEAKKSNIRSFSTLKKYAPDGSNYENYEILDQILVYIFRVYDIQGKSANNSSPLFVLHHGAGYSALTFALAALHIKNLTNGESTIFAYDCRGHGKTKTSDDLNLSLGQLSQDLVDVLKAAFGNDVITNREIFLVGHSMGGCVVADVMSRKLISSATCMAVIDVVEGSAMEALSGMLNFCRNRPSEFKTLEDAILWSKKSGSIRNIESARISIPCLLTEQETHTNIKKYTWRTDLAATQPHWEGWFSGLSEKFLSSNAAKLLILAGTDRLDKPLTIAQMQGKYQLMVLPEAGHMVQEDIPERTASALVDFWKRNEKLILPVKKPFINDK
ncbi:protein phosphatase methylesterase [Gigaspora margarita]|uniref:Protein phosphatase methylesterase 1 n=1 Tax=Gigaspora margarita TaxID=4874 RepID=A0A8H4EPV7_GIGMA|nr:protein phosphatase methylesterase [Gigaspora margarita]